ncbi:hypothetical protein [Aurantiacibacter rhizosphaerae]|uniref:DUF2927 domain-containing protein n=1 Tax=Aurantiacibacter rhizosphaerae TaxID=2691582 RepID=A0A844XEN5_9SPHN|nr:hypothetical protein [Aurantiacibacter rhizosphaerae]MWV28476.1 hypothetical protein [Aurantiacibacter rhizosphaerae]
MDLRRSFAAIALCTAVPFTPAQAQDGAQDAPEGRDIVVSGDLPDDSDVRETVHAIMRERGSTQPLVRFLDPLCLHVTGMASRANAFVRERVLANAREAGLDVEEGKCRANAVIFVVADAADLIGLLEEQQPGLLQPDNRTRVKAEARRGDPVVAWHNLEDRSQQGGRMAHSSTVPGAAGASPLYVGVRVNSHGRPGRTSPSHSRAVVSGAVVMETDWLVGMDLERVSDFATMRLLAPGMMPDDFVFDVPPSVTSPFMAGEGEEEMTRFDRAYLRALYGLSPDASARSLPAAVVRAYMD